MTIAISLKANAGLVLAADSAFTIIAADDLGHTGVVNVYNHANKVFKGRPAGAITWGGSKYCRQELNPAGGRT